MTESDVEEVFKFAHEIFKDLIESRRGGNIVYRLAVLQNGDIQVRCIEKYKNNPGVKLIGYVSVGPDGQAVSYTVTKSAYDEMKEEK